MRIESISVRGLLGRYDYDIPLNQDKRVTVLVGPNGCGKTTLLKLVLGAALPPYADFLDLPFRTLTLTFGDAPSLTFTRVIDPGAGDAVLLRVTRDDGASFDTTAVQLTNDFCAARDGQNPEGSVPEWWRTHPLIGLHSPGEWELCVWMVDSLRQYSRDLPFVRHGEEVESRPADDVLYDSRTRVQAVAERVKDEIRHLTVEYGEASFSQDATYLARLRRLASERLDDIATLRERLRRIGARQRRYVDLGIMDADVRMSDDASDLIDDRTRTGLALYAHDMERKLAFLQPRIDRLESFARIVNGYFHGKRVRLSKDGLSVFTTGPNGGRLIPVSMLSSGEQHLLALFEALIPRDDIKGVRLMMVDEPELSMHLAWQTRLLDDLIEVAQLSNCHFLLATHSPDIIQDHWDAVVDLGRLRP